MKRRRASCVVVSLWLMWAAPGWSQDVMELMGEDPLAPKEGSQEPPKPQEAPKKEAEEGLLPIEAKPKAVARPKTAAVGGALGSVPEGWVSVEAPPGREVALSHPPTLARMEARRLGLSKEQASALRQNLEGSLKKAGFALEGKAREVELGGGGRKGRLWTSKPEVGGLEFVVLVLQLEGWEVTAAYRPTEEHGASSLEAAVLEFGGSLP